MRFANFVKGCAVVAAVGFTTIAAVGSLLCLLPENPLPKDRRKPIFDIAPGDMVQWDSMGRFVFDAPKRVERVENSEFGLYVFVEGGSTGIPIEDCVKIS